VKLSIYVGVFALFVLFILAFHSSFLFFFIFLLFVCFCVSECENSHVGKSSLV
jgi:hypothetical protein